MELDPPVVVTIILYVPVFTPAGTVAVNVVSLVALTDVNTVVSPSSNFTLITSDVVNPPQNPVPVIVTGVVPRFEPLFGVTVATVGAGVVTMNC